MKKLGIHAICELLAGEEETVVVELLDLSSQDLIDEFKPRIRERIDYLNKYYAENFEEETTFRQERRESACLGSKAVWENAGFDLEKESY